MNSTSIFMLIALAAGSVTIIISALGLISDHKKSRIASREKKRKNLSENTVKTVMGYRTQQASASERYRRRA